MKYESLLPDHFYHIYNRGNNREDLFIEEKNYHYFISLLTKHITPVAEIYAYCLLKNHFHLLIRIKENQIKNNPSQAFSNFFNAYAKAINKAYSRTGSLFQDRFKRIPVKDENYLINLIIYIHLNPVNHGFVQDFKKYRFSSYEELISEMPTFLERQQVLNIFEDKQNFVSVHTTKRNSEFNFEPII